MIQQPPHQDACVCVCGDGGRRGGEGFVQGLVSRQSSTAFRGPPRRLPCLVRGCVAGEQVRARPDLAGGPLSVTFPSDCADFGSSACACLLPPPPGFYSDTFRGCTVKCVQFAWPQPPAMLSASLLPRRGLSLTFLRSQLCNRRLLLLL